MNNKEKMQVALLVLVFIILPVLGCAFRIVYGNNTYTNMGLFLVLATEGIVIGKIIFDNYKEYNNTKKANRKMLINHD